jgi:hypothetical protein
MTTNDYMAIVEQRRKEHQVGVFDLSWRTDEKRVIVGPAISPRIQ